MKKLISCILVFCLCFSLLPVSAFAADTEENGSTDEEIITSSGPMAEAADEEEELPAGESGEQTADAFTQAVEPQNVEELPAQNRTEQDDEAASALEEGSGNLEENQDGDGSGDPAEAAQESAEEGTAEDAAELLTDVSEMTAVGDEAALNGNIAASGNCGAQDDNLSWTLYDDGELVITGTGAMANCSESSPWDDYKDSILAVSIGSGVETIGNNAFARCGNLASVSLPEGLTAIGGNAFSGCTSLASIALPNSLTNVGWQVFSGCDALTNLTLPGNLSGISDAAFSDIPNLVSVTLSEGMTTTGHAAFSGCYSLTEVLLPSTLTSIGDFAFQGTALTTISLPAGLTTIGFRAFASCSALTDVYFGGTEEQWNAITVGENNAALTSATIHYNSAGATERTVVDSGNCGAQGDNLSWTLYNDGELVITGTGAMAYYSSPWDIDNQAPWYAYKSAVSTITVENGVTSIGGYAFCECSDVTAVSLPSSVNMIQMGAFYGCTGITGISLPSGLNQIQVDAFCDCSGLTSITIPEGVTSIKDGVFYGCSGLTSVTIPAGVSNIYSGAFYGCSSLADVCYGGTEADWTWVEVYADNDALLAATKHFTAAADPETTATVTFIANGGSLSTNGSVASRVKTVAKGALLSDCFEYAVTPYYSDDSKMFDCWSYDQAGNNRADNLYGTPVTENLTVYAQWTDAVTITWSGSTVRTQTVKRGSYLISAPGYAWYYDSACTKSMDIFHHRFDEDITIYLPAYDPENRVRVTFDLNGGVFRSDSGSDLTEIVVTLDAGQPLQDEAYTFSDYYYTHSYHKDGYSLAGWTLTQNGTDELDFSRSFTEDTTVYAKWADAYTVRLDGNGRDFCNGSSYIDISVPTEQTVAEAIAKYVGSDWQLQSSTYTDESGEYIIGGWYYDAACSSALGANDPASAVTLYAHWVSPYAIHFDLNGGFVYGGLDDYLVAPGMTVNTDPYIYRSDDRFILTGWSTQRSGGTLIPDLTQYVPTQSGTLYAQWAKGAEIFFLSDRPFSDGSKNYKRQVLDGHAVGSVSLDAGCDGRIEGWYYDIGLTRSAGNLEELYPDGNTTLYAKWTDAAEPGMPTFASHSLLLTGEIGVNFYMDLSGLTEAEKAASTMTFTVNGKEQTDVFDARHTNQGGDGYYGFTCFISSVQLADTITAVFHYGDGQTVTQTYRAADYVSYVSQNPDLYSSEVRSLVDSLLVYGACAQPFLAANNHWTVGVQHETIGSGAPLNEGDLTTLVNAAKQYISANGLAFGKDLGSSKVARVSYSLDLQSKTDLRVYFALQPGYAGAVTATLDGRAVAAVRQSDGRFLVTVPSVAAHELSTMHTIVLSAGGDCTVTVSALSYVDAALRSNSTVFANDTARAAVASLFYYHYRAANYMASLEA